MDKSEIESAVSQAHQEYLKRLQEQEERRQQRERERQERINKKTLKIRLGMFDALPELLREFFHGEDCKIDLLEHTRYQVAVFDKIPNCAPITAHFLQGQDGNGDPVITLDSFSTVWPYEHDHAIKQDRAASKSFVEILGIAAESVLLEKKLAAEIDAYYKQQQEEEADKAHAAWRKEQEEKWGKARKEAQEAAQQEARKGVQEARRAAERNASEGERILINNIMRSENPLNLLCVRLVNLEQRVNALDEWTLGKGL